MRKRRRTEQDMLFEHNQVPPPQRGSTLEIARRRERRRRALLLQIGVPMGILVLIYLALPLVLRAGKMRPELEDLLSREIGRRVHIGSLRYSPSFGSIIADDVSLEDDPTFSSAPFLHAEAVEIFVRRWPLITRRAVEITGALLEAPTITAIRKQGGWNYDAILAARPARADGAAGPQIRVTRGILMVRGDNRSDAFVMRDVDFYAQHFSTAHESPFSMTASIQGGGAVKIDGRSSAVQWSGGRPVMAMNVLVNARKVALVESNLTRSLAPGIAGALSYSGTIESDETRLTIAGNAEFTNLKLSSSGEPTKDPVQFVFATEYNRTTGAGKLTRCDAIEPKGSATIEGTYTIANDDIRVRLRASARGILVAPVAGMVSAAGLPLPRGTTIQGGQAFAELVIDGSLKQPTTKGTVSVQNTKVMAFDLEDRLTAVTGLDALHVSRDLPMDSMKVNVEMTPDKTRLTNLEIDLPEIGTLTGGGVINADRVLDLQLAVVRRGVAEKRPIPVLVRGASVSPVFLPAGTQ